MRNRFPYSRTYLSSMTNNVDKRLVEFYTKHKGEFFLKMELYDMVCSIVKTQFKNALLKEELSKVRRIYRRQVVKKKSNWMNSAVTNAEQITPSQNSKQYPFNDLYTKYKLMTDEEWNLLYGKKTFEDIVEEEIVKIQEWEEDSTSLLIEFPLFENLTPKRKASAFEMDLTMNLLNLALSDELLAERHMRSYVDEMTNAPYFTDNGRKQYTVPKNKDFKGEIYISDDEKLELSVDKNSIGEDGHMKLLDETDMQCLMFIVQRAALNPIAGVTVDIETRDLVEVIYPKTKNGNYSSIQYDEAENRLHKIASHTYKGYRKVGNVHKQVGSVNYLSSVLNYTIDNRRYCSITLGDVIYDKIVGNKVRMIPSYEINMLKSPTSRILSLMMHRERIKSFYRFKNGLSDECSTCLTIHSFMRAVNFSGTGTGTSNGEKLNKTKIMNIIVETLEEFKKSNVFIKDYLVDNITEQIYILFSPLTNNEEMDLELCGYNASDIRDMLEDSKHFQ